MTSGSRQAWRIALEAGAVFALAAAIRLAGIHQEAIHDELHHVLAARAWLETGTLSIAGGEPYLRARPFTLLIAGLFSLFGESLAVARLPALIAGSLLCSLAFVWLACLRQRGAAWFAALLLALDPHAVVASQWARFYTIQEVAFLVGSAAIFAWMRGVASSARAAALAAGAAACFGIAIYLQLTCAIGVAGVALAALPVLGRPWLVGAEGRPRIGVLAGLAAGGLLALGLAWRLGVWAWLVDMATYTDLWAASQAGAYRYYYGILLEDYAAFWPLFPLLWLLALRRRPDLAWFAGIVFGVSFAAHSLLAWKSWRYFEYAMPMFAFVCGLGCVEALARLRAWLPQLLDRFVPNLGSLRQRQTAVLALVAAVSGFALVSNRALLETARAVRAGDPSLSFPGMLRANGTLSWSSAGAELADVSAQVDAVVSSDALKALYYLGRVDYELNRDHLQMGNGIEPEFTLDGPSGRPVVSEPESIERIMACHGSGLVIAERRLWGTSWSVPEETARWIAAHASEAELPEAWGLLAFRWETPSPDRSRCPARRNPSASNAGGAPA